MKHVLKHERELRGWSQAKVAEEVGTTVNSVSQWERNLFRPSPYFRERLCQLFEKNAEELGLLEESEPTEVRCDEQVHPHTSDILSTSPCDPLLTTPPLSLKRQEETQPSLPFDSFDQMTREEQGAKLLKDAQEKAQEARVLAEASIAMYKEIDTHKAEEIQKWLTTQSFFASKKSNAFWLYQQRKGSIGTHFLSKRRRSILILALLLLVMTGFVIARESIVSSRLVISSPQIAVPTRLSSSFQIRPQVNRVMCVDVASGDTNDGARVHLFPCHRGYSNQEWHFVDGHLDVFDKCLEVMNVNAHDGTALQLFDCLKDEPSQHWEYIHGQLKIVGKCLDVTGANSSSDAILQLVDCRAASNQIFEETMYEPG
jgi:transcriptional regulator with XRE-family HTH domain